MGEKFNKLRRKIVVLKFTMSRGYVWCQVPTLSIIAAGILKPYFPELRFYQLVIIGFIIFMVVGYIDRRFGFLNEEQSYGTERNTLLMKGLFGKGNNSGEKVEDKTAEELVEELNKKSDEKE